MCYFFDRLTGRTIENVINMGSYNYLGFAENNVDFLKTVAEETRQYGVGVCSTRQELGMCGYTTNETYLQSQKQVTHRIQHCLFKNKHSRLLSNYFGLVNAITNLSKAFFSNCDQTCFEQRSQNSSFTNRRDKIFFWVTY